MMGVDRADVTYHRWGPYLLLAAVLLSGFAGVLAVLAMQYLAGREALIFFAILGLWLTILLSIVKFDFMVLVTFCLLGMVRIEPAPVDALSMIFTSGPLDGKAITEGA
jgi:hypothetical protein